MRLHDTARRELVTLELPHHRAGLYVCGITPYDGGHLGHAFTYHTFDVLTRRLRDRGVTVRSVRNVTDVDDDILRVARQRGIDFRTLGESQLARFDADMLALNLLPVDAEPRATAHIPRMVEWIGRLVAAEAAYRNDGWVYFDVTAHPRYGSLSGLDAAQMTELSRLRGADPDDPRKRHPLDFVLWQPSRPDEPSWPAPWGEGRPGWHIECSVLAATELGTPIDIHGGGDDLIYPHHESEIAQAEAGGVSDYVRLWVHVAMVRYQGEKMSKSLGNLVFVRDLLEEVPASVVRLLLAAHHHRQSWEYSEAELDAARARHARYRAVLDGTLPRHQGETLAQRFRDRLDDDLDTPGALRVLDQGCAAARPGERGMPLGELLADCLGLIGAGVGDATRRGA